MLKIQYRRKLSGIKPRLDHRPDGLCGQGDQILSRSWVEFKHPRGRDEQSGQ